MGLDFLLAALGGVEVAQLAVAICHAIHDVGEKGVLRDTAMEETEDMAKLLSCLHGLLAGEEELGQAEVSEGAQFGAFPGGLMLKHLGVMVFDLKE